MLHTHDDFLSAIAAQPADRTLRLVYADWLDERSEPHGELIRVEEEMRELPVFSDRFWELKPRRNALRARVGAEWCGKMRYGTECEPVFRHGIPDGWRERWRLIREFTERWHRVPMPDVGGRQKEIAETETRLGRELPPSVREWIAFAHDAQDATGYDHAFWNRTGLEAIDNDQSLLLTNWPYRGTQVKHFTDPDPSVYGYEPHTQNPSGFVLATTVPVASSVTVLSANL
ncbi:MAG: TIGR02996 domain-containing protein [Planctomycetes bacterium]|nr:TIGR02996 domain-containing protein [Planctomycetota bacterium]